MIGSEAAHTGVHKVCRRFLELAQDILVVGLGLVPFALMGRTVVGLTLELFEPLLNFRHVIAEVLFVLVMVEVLRLLIVYLQEHRVAVDFMVELGIVSTLREIVLRGVTDLDWKLVMALSIFLLALGAVLRYGGLRQRGLSIQEPQV